MANRDNERRTRKERILPSPINVKVAGVVSKAITPQAASGLPGPLLGGRFPEGDDMEVCCSINARGDRLFLAVNWDSRPRSVRLPAGRGFDEPPAESYLLGPDGQWSAWQGALRPELRLGAEEVLVARLEGK